MKYDYLNYYNKMTNNPVRHMTESELKAQVAQNKRLPENVHVHCDADRISINLDDVNAARSTLIIKDAVVQVDHGLIASKLEIDNSNYTESVAIKDSRVEEIFAKGAYMVTLQNIEKLSCVTAAEARSIELGNLPDLTDLDLGSDFSKNFQIEIKNVPNLQSCDEYEVIQISSEEESEAILKQGDLYTYGFFKGNKEDLLAYMEDGVDENHEALQNLEAEKNEELERYRQEVEAMLQRNSDGKKEAIYNIVKARNLKKSFLNAVSAA